MQDLSQVVYAIGRSTPSGVQILGTAFAVAFNRIATAFHVVGGDDSNLVLILPRMSSFDDYQDTTDGVLKLYPVTIAAADPLHDLCVLGLADGFVSFGYSLGGADDVRVGESLVTLGFPHANMGRLVLTQQQAAVGARVLIDNRGEKNKHIVMNVQAREGQSGGPVFDSAMKKVVAVLLGSYAPAGGGGISLGGVDPHTLHQTTHAISAEYLKAML
ncbi:serine protease [Curtobacterium sp. MCJR17_020]|uniref:S1 family peptidase n=1 Tax=Curtobacterium sp. MCJR17_020 TaxID=2175619 RepID=UPI000DAA2386|nr:serine protease [Curtobacterium sp. MCJR17_020]WIE71323.1 serine protease [Curtobacterium sp. MCJR17_020]